MKPRDAAALTLPEFAARPAPAIFLCCFLQLDHRWDSQVRVAPLTQSEHEALAAGSFNKALVGHWARA